MGFFPLNQRQRKTAVFVSLSKMNQSSFLKGPVCSIEYHLMQRKHIVNKVNVGWCFLMSPLVTVSSQLVSCQILNPEQIHLLDYCG